MTTSQPQAPAPPHRRPRWRRRLGLSVLVAGSALLLLHGLWLPRAVEAWGPALARRFAGVELELREVLRLGYDASQGYDGTAVPRKSANDGWIRGGRSRYSMHGCAWLEPAAGACTFYYQPIAETKAT